MLYGEQTTKDNLPTHPRLQRTSDFEGSGSLSLFQVVIRNLQGE